MFARPRRAGAPALAVALCFVAVLWAWPTDAAGEWIGRVMFKGAPVPGATVVAVLGDQRVVTTTDADGLYRLTLADGVWTMRVEMRGFVPLTFDVDPAAPSTSSEMTLAAPGSADLGAWLQPLDIDRSTHAAAGPTTEGAKLPDVAMAAEGLVVNGSVYNAAASPFAQAPAFGNFRPSRRSLYSGSFGVTGGHSAWDARPYSFTGRPGTSPAYGDVQVSGAFGGPIRIPFTARVRPNLTVSYERGVATSAETVRARVPTALERSGDLSTATNTDGEAPSVIDPLTGVPFPGAVIPVSRLSPQALALLTLYPDANVVDSAVTNFEASVADRTVRDALQFQLTSSLTTRQQVSGSVSFRRTATTSTSLFDFADRSNRHDLTATVTWSFRLSPTKTLRARYEFVGAGIQQRPYFADRIDVSGDAGIDGNDRLPGSWGPPNLHFRSGIASLTNTSPASQRSGAHAAAVEGSWLRGYHNVSFGGEVRPHRVDAASRVDPRGTFTFTGAATGHDFADFLLGLPQASHISFGDDRTFLGTSAHLFMMDDWRVVPSLTISAGVRWEFESPYREFSGRLANLDLAPDFGLAARVQPDGNTGPITGTQYGRSLIGSDYSRVQPRVGLAWRPLAASSLLVRGGYGVYRQTDTYLPIAMWLARQPPFSTTASTETSDARPLTLADGFPATRSMTPNTLAVDPRLRVGYAENWNLAVQRDLPASFAFATTYLGTRGHHLLQQSLPNTVPPGAIRPCQDCPIGFVYVSSNGSSSRHALQVQLRRRLRSGLAGNVVYTFAKATDDATAFAGVSAAGSSIAQNWQDTTAERSPSTFDQRHLLAADVEYTSGIGAAGGALLAGWRGRLLKGWVLAARLSVGSGLPVTPRYLATVPGTGVTGVIRASLTGEGLAPPPGFYLNPSAYLAPAPGEWGTAGRNSARGPSQFSLNASIGRSFAARERMSLDWRLDVTNVLDRVSYVSVHTLVGSPQFGLPDRAASMRKLRMSLRWRF